MAERESPLIEPGDIASALGLLTRLPVAAGGNRRSEAAWAWPLAGVVVAVIAWLAGKLALMLGVGPGLASMAALAVLALATGALHEDGLADTADGLLGSASRERRLQIMADSRIGAFGALALILVTLARWQALGVLALSGNLLGGLLAAATISRGVLPVIMLALPPARPGGLAASTGRPPKPAALLALAIAALIALAAAGWAAVPALVAAGAIAATVGWIAQTRIGGQTGDVLGATQQLCEVAVLAALVAAS